MDILHNNKLINEIVDKLFRNKRTDYSQFHLCINELIQENMLLISDIQHEVHHVMNQNYEKLYISLFRKCRNPELCIIFMHGYGSNRLECQNIIRILPQEYALCSFDFSGSGKSEGDMVTYGMKEKEDINSIINYLRQMEFKKFILWGRSMGATSALLYCLKYNPHDVVLQIIDSPFYSFEMIAFEIANKNVKAPEFIISFALQMAKKNCSKFKYNPFAIELSNIGQCKVCALFLYHQEDNIINSQNTHLICSRYQATYQKLAIQQNHNTIRSQDTIFKILNFIEKYSKKYKLSSRQGQLVFSCKPSNIKSQCGTPKRKGISRGQHFADKQNCPKYQERWERQSPVKRTNDYGLWLETKINTEMICNPQPHFGQRKNLQKKNHLSLTSSPISKNKKGLNLNSSPLYIQQMQTQICHFNVKTMAEQKVKNKKISTVTAKSLGGNKSLNTPKHIRKYD